MNTLENTWTWLQGAMAWPIIQTTDFRISAGSLAALVVLVLLLFWASKRLQRWLSEGPVLRNRLDPGARMAVAAVVRYTVLLVGLLAIVQTVGIDLTTFNVMAGAIGIGVGFGLQNVVSNFIAGLIIMFERPVKIGDRIVVGGVAGNVVDIGARSTTVLDNDNIAVIVPNSKFITEDVINWKYNDDNVRFHVPVSVAYGTDAQLVKRVLLEVAHADPDVLDEPEPNVWLQAFGDDGVAFELMVWSATMVDRKGKLISQLNYAIYERFNAEGIEFPFPQRDLHIKGGVLGIRQVPAG
ncbi:mechanosensitive ion channel domain-containing protein [Hydrogenophaga sp.]|uniref:mechanosensitive ion channel family protein n=1 Tax=Hydrogenophaga sp. TaxID=1904254 RepID=UPI00260A11EB|nr:mechanosensitive ion channel domain-containing protein [Hydrogenophaga sp.]MDM7948958.1 mechanosensitive ion channel [Hydrogenophaga sp.]